MYNHKKGVTLAVASVLASTVVIITGTHLLQYLNLISFSIFWFGISSLFFLITDIFLPGQTFFRVPLKYLPPVILVGLVEIPSALTYFEALRLTNPSFIGFFSNFQALTLPAIGIVFMKERFTLLEIIGGITSIAGAVIMSYSGAEVIDKGTIYFIASIVLFSISTVIVKHYSGKVNPLSFSAYRCIIVFLGVLVIAPFTSGFDFNDAHVPAGSMLLGALCGPFLSIIFYFLALKYTEMTRVVLIRTSTPLFAMTGGYVFLASAPQIKHISGGILLTIGVVLFVFARKSQCEKTPPPKTAECRDYSQ